MRKLNTQLSVQLMGLMIVGLMRRTTIYWILATIRLLVVHLLLMARSQLLPVGRSQLLLVARAVKKYGYGSSSSLIVVSTEQLLMLLSIFIQGDSQPSWNNPNVDQSCSISDDHTRHLSKDFPAPGSSIRSLLCH